MEQLLAVPKFVEPVAAIVTETVALGNSRIELRSSCDLHNHRGEPRCYRCHSSYQAFTGSVIRDIRPVRKILDSSRRDAAWSWLLQARMARNEEVMCPKHGR
ncbi:MAG: hypothetical protein WBX03_15355, partial [Terriglobales bacterium]